MNARLISLGLIAATILPPLSAQTVAPEAEADLFDDYGDYGSAQISDPFEPVNRAIFKFNDVTYEHVLWPVARGYEKTVPAGVRGGVLNFFENLRYPVRLVSSVLQGKFTRAGQETSKFIVNTSIGMAGLFRMSDRLPALTHVPAEDLGQTFGVWGIGNGPYLMVPLLGGFGSRDLVGRVGDTFISPLGWQYAEWGNREWLGEARWQWQTAAFSADTISSLPHSLRNYREFKKAALDPYIAVRDGLISNRKQQVQQ